MFARKLIFIWVQKCEDVVHRRELRDVLLFLTNVPMDVFQIWGGWNPLRCIRFLQYCEWSASVISVSFATQNHFTSALSDYVCVYNYSLSLFTSFLILSDICWALLKSWFRMAHCVTNYKGKENGVSVCHNSFHCVQWGIPWLPVWT